MINWGTFMMEVSKTPSVLIGLVFTAITICLIRRLLQFAHWIRHDAMMDVPSFLKKLDDMLPADDYSPNAGVDEGADHADDRADPND